MVAFLERNSCGRTDLTDIMTLGIFFFQAEDGIRDVAVTGVQTCALPISQKREAILQDVPFSVSATSQDQIRNSGSESLIDLARNVAGFTIADLGPGQSQIEIGRASCRERV